MWQVTMEGEVPLGLGYAQLLFLMCRLADL